MHNEINSLYKLHDTFSVIATRFRERVCEECNYSIPTFYRKMRSNDTFENGKIKPALSNAEKDKIHLVAKEVKDELETLLGT